MCFFIQYQLRWLFLFLWYLLLIWSLIYFLFYLCFALKFRYIKWLDIFWYAWQDQCLISLFRKPSCYEPSGSEVCCNEFIGDVTSVTFLPYLNRYCQHLLVVHKTLTLKNNVPMKLFDILNWLKFKIQFFVVGFTRTHKSL